MRWGERVILGSQRWVGQSQIIVANYILSLLMVGGSQLAGKKWLSAVLCFFLLYGLIFLSILLQRSVTQFRPRWSY